MQFKVFYTTIRDSLHEQRDRIVEAEHPDDARAVVMQGKAPGTTIVIKKIKVLS